MDVKERGYAGKILHLKLSDLSYEVIPTEKYVEWGGGNSLGTKLFWDYCEDKTLRDGRTETNVVVIASSPLSGTSAPSAGGRTEMVGIGYGQYPIAWFTRSNFGGRYSAMMKFAGWDAIVISGKAPHPVWIEIENSKIVYHGADDLWGKRTKETQLAVMGKLDTENLGWGWKPLPGKSGSDYTTQRPAVLCIGPAGENQVVHAALNHDASNIAGQGGLAAVWGFKNLKAISVMGTGKIKVADPMSLVTARFRIKERYAGDVHDPGSEPFHWGFLGGTEAINFSGETIKTKRKQSCAGCIMGCRARYSVGYGNEVKCQATSFYSHFLNIYYKGHPEKIANVALKLATYVDDLGLNSYAFDTSLPWLEGLWHRGILGKGKKIDTDLDFNEIGSEAFGKAFLDAFARKRDIGAVFADGFVQGAIRLGLEEDYRSGKLKFPYWGVTEHGYDSRGELEWGFASILTDRDINSHDLNTIFWPANLDLINGYPFGIEAREVAELVADKLKPYASGPECIDYSDRNMYSDAVLNTVRWYIHNNRFWKNSAMFCDFRWASLFDTNAPGNVGATADEEVGEQVFWNAVTGDDISYLDGLKMGYRAFVLQNAIWALQGRHRDIVQFADYIYDKKWEHFELPFFLWPCRDENGIWKYTDVMHRKIDREKFEEWKTRFYKAEGLDPKTGWPTEETLKKLGLDFAIDELKAHKKLG